MKINPLVINLNPNFEPFGGYSPEFWKFPSGAELGVKIADQYGGLGLGSSITVTARLNSSEEIIKLLMLSDALKRRQPAHMDLFISYLPYARQDRIMVNGESFSLKVMANLINSMGFRKVQIFNPHSNVSSLLINNVEEITDHEFVRCAVYTYEDYVLVSPDFGASKKIYELAKHLYYKGEIVQANKVRDLNTGKIVKLNVSGDVKDKHCVIVDDICSKGGTFIYLADALKKIGAKKVTLIVSHYEDSADKSELFKYLDYIVTTNSFCKSDSDSKFNFRVIPLSSHIL